MDNACECQIKFLYGSAVAFGLHYCPTHAAAEAMAALLREMIEYHGVHYLYQARTRALLATLPTPPPDGYASRGT